MKPVLPGEMDRTPPDQQIPVYFIHSFEQPFCEVATCRCHAQRQEVVKLFVKLVEGYFELEQAANFIDDNSEEAVQQ